MAEDYSADGIIVLDGLEAVRRRPGMYMGDVRDGSALHHMLWEVVSNSIDEHLAGHATRVRVSIEGGIAEVEDDGRGIPVDPLPGRNMSMLDWVLTTLHAGATFDGHAPHVHVSPFNFGIGLAAVNALSAELEIEVRRKGYSWRKRFACGKPQTELERGARTEKTGTRIRFVPDPSIFTLRTFDREAVRERLGELAIWNPDLRFELMSERIHEPGGAARWIQRMADEAGSDSVGEIFTTKAVRNDILVEVACAWTDQPYSELRSFVGQSLTDEGGTHERGFWHGLSLAVLEHGKRATLRGSRRLKHLRRYIEPGLLGVVHVMLRDPRFAGPTRGRLASTAAAIAVRDHLIETFGAHLERHPALARKLLARVSG